MIKKSPRHYIQEICNIRPIGRQARFAMGFLFRIPKLAKLAVIAGTPMKERQLLSASLSHPERSLTPVPEIFWSRQEDSYDRHMPLTEQMSNSGCLSDTQVYLPGQVRNLQGDAAGIERVALR